MHPLLRSLFCTALLSAAALRAETVQWESVLVLSNEHLTVKAVPDIGRIIHLSRTGGPNLLRQDSDLIGITKVPEGRWAWNNHGGDWLWPVAQDRWEQLGVERRWPPPALFEYAPWTGAILEDNRIRLQLSVGDPLNIDISRTLSFDDNRPNVLIIQQSILRTAPSDIPVCLWQISQMADVGDAEMEIPENTRHPQGVHFIQGPDLEDGALLRKGETLYVQTQKAKGAKLGTDGTRISGTSPAGRLIVEVINGDEPGELPDGGCALALAVGRQGEYAELETMSVEKVLAPGEKLKNTVIYILNSETP
ncbi:MAG: hypothetical protein JJU05_07065 [Verrucomicrobia bacterium]|nr:hypothetical protein [Verrucomicrobiota bacterium]MCH8526057.1 DUF4380 domain-containing protein [Kiritimatiellia bacterium]